MTSTLTARPRGTVLACLVAVACGGAKRQPPPPPERARVLVSGSPGTDGVFDPAPASDGAGGLWMSHSAVRPSPHATALNQVRTRLASSADGGLTWTDAGVDPNGMVDADLQLPASWATWRFEVSRLVRDPHDTDANRRWKLLWHRVLAIPGGTEGVPSFAHSWVGLSTAPAPTGPWSAERKLFTGSAYDAAGADGFLGPPELPLDRLFPDAAALGGCAGFTEPGVLARADGLYVSLQCAGAGKLVLLRCSRGFTACEYLGDLVAGSEVGRFSLAGQALQGIAASELVEAGGQVFLLATPYEPPADTYRGCLVFRVQDLPTAALERSGGAPVLWKRVAGTPDSFHGACGWDAAAGEAGILLSEYAAQAPHFRIFATRQALP